MTPDAAMRSRSSHHLGGATKLHAFDPSARIYAPDANTAPAVAAHHGFRQCTKRAICGARPAPVFIPLPQSIEGVRRLLNKQLCLTPENAPAMLSAAIRVEARHSTQRAGQKLRAREQLMSRSVAPGAVHLSLLRLFAGLWLGLAAVGSTAVWLPAVAHAHSMASRLALGAPA